jgi:hypothetical protein
LVGWGWLGLGDCKYVPQISNHYIKTRVCDIDRSNEHRDKLTLEIDDPQYEINGEYVTAIPWCDGIEFDFKDRICSIWCLFFGNGTVLFDGDTMPIYLGESGFKGWGSIGYKVADIRNHVPGIVELDAFVRNR